MVEGFTQHIYTCMHSRGIIQSIETEGECPTSTMLPHCHLYFMKLRVYTVSLTCTVDNSPDVIKHLKIALGVVVAVFLVLLVLLGPCGCYCICCYYKDNVHNRCKEKFKCVNLVTCCKKNYIPINEPIGNNQQNAQINNQNEPA